MRRTLYGVLKDTKRAASDLRADGVALAPEVEQALGRFEAAVRHALASSPDGETIAQAEELVAIDALCDLHVSLQTQPEDLRSRLRPIIDDWIEHAASGVTSQDLERRAATGPAAAPLDSWLDAQER